MSLQSYFRFVNYFKIIFINYRESIVYFLFHEIIKCRLSSEVKEGVMKMEAWYEAPVIEENKGMGFMYHWTSGRSIRPAHIEIIELYRRGISMI